MIATCHSRRVGWLGRRWRSGVRWIAPVVLGHVWRDVQRTQLGHVIDGVIGLVVRWSRPSDGSSCARLRPRSVSRQPKKLVRDQRLHLGMVQKLGHEFGKHFAVLQPGAVLRKRRRVLDCRPAQALPTSDTADCSPAAPSTVVPSGSRRRPGAAAHSATVQGDRGTSFVRIKPRSVRFSSPRTSRSSSRVLRSGWSFGTRASGET